MAAFGALAVTMACAGPTSPVPTGFEDDCTFGPRISGEAEMGVGKGRTIADVDARVTMGGRIGGTCLGASTGDRD